MSLSEATGWVADLSFTAEAKTYVVAFSGGAYSGSAGTVTYSIADRKVSFSAPAGLKWGNDEAGASGSLALSDWAKSGRFDVWLPSVGASRAPVHIVGTWRCPSSPQGTPG
jgi:hypothetical protein